MWKNVLTFAVVLVVALFLFTNLKGGCALAPQTPEEIERGKARERAEIEMEIAGHRNTLAIRADLYRTRGWLLGEQAYQDAMRQDLDRIAELERKLAALK